MTGQDVNISPLKFLADDLLARLIESACDRVAKLFLQLGELANLPAEGVRADPLLADPAFVHDGSLAIPGLLGIGEAASQPPP